MLNRAIFIVACAFAFSVPAIAGDTTAAPTISPNVLQFQRVPVDVNTLTERVHVLETTVQQAQIANLSSQLLQLRDQLSQEIKSAEQSASQAYGTAAQAIQSAAAAQSGVDTLNTKSAKWDKTAEDFPGHTHSYQKTEVGVVNHTCQNGASGPDNVPCSQITGTTAATLTTSPPQ